MDKRHNHYRRHDHRIIIIIIIIIDLMMTLAPLQAQDDLKSALEAIGRPGYLERISAQGTGADIWQSVHGSGSIGARELAFWYVREVVVMMMMMTAIVVLVMVVMTILYVEVCDSCDQGATVLVMQVQAGGAAGRADRLR
jgi:hypothetical protein